MTTEALQLPEEQKPTETESPVSSSRELQVCYFSRGADTDDVPQIKLCGKWLESLGFGIGDRVNVIMRDRLLIIERLDPVVDDGIDYKSELKAVKRGIKQLLR